MAATLEQLQKEYDDELARINAMPQDESKQAAKKALNARFPKGRPTSVADVADGTVTKVSIAEKLGLVAALLLDETYGEKADPFIKQVFDLFDKDPVKAEEIFRNKTKFGRLSPTAQSRYLAQLENSTVYKENRDEWKNRIRILLKKNGINFTEQQLDDYYLKGTPESIIENELLKGTKFLGDGATPKGSAGETYNELIKTARRNGISESLLPKILGFETMDDVLKELQLGESINVFDQKIRNYAKTAMPDYVRNLIDQGNDLQDIIGPYVATISDVLEVPYTSVDVTDKYVQNALAKNMTLSDLRKELRKDTRWQYTDSARKESSDAVLSVLRDFGFQG